MVNKVILVGNLGADPEVRTLESGVKVARISLATTEVYKDKMTGERRENTEWHRVVLWRRLAEIAGEFLKKGSKIYVEGQLQTRKWEQEGQTRYTTEIVAREIQFLDSKGSKEGSNLGSTDMPEEGSAPDVADSGIEDDDIPF